MTKVPQPVLELVDLIAGLSGTVAVVLGGSHALGVGDPESDWDIGLYYRREIDLTELAAIGTVHSPGSWGRIMNGGAWLDCEDIQVDVLLRDMDSVEHWTERAENGEFEVDLLLGYIAGVPTYLLTAELASCKVLRGHLPAVSFPPRLAAAAPASWRFRRSFSLEYARKYARRGSVLGAAGNVSKAAMEEAHARMCERELWICNEKRLIEAAGLGGVQNLFKTLPRDADKLEMWVDLVADQINAT